MSEDLNKRHKATLDVALLDLDVAAIPSKSDVFVRCGPAARDLHDAITDLRARLQAAEERAEKAENENKAFIRAASWTIQYLTDEGEAWAARRLIMARDRCLTDGLDAALKTEGA